MSTVALSFLCSALLYLRGMPFPVTPFTPLECQGGVQILYMIVCEEKNVVFVVFVIQEREKADGSFVGIGGSKDWTFLMHPAGVIVIIANCIDALSALVPLLVDRCEGI